MTITMIMFLSIFIVVNFMVYGFINNKSDLKVMRLYKIKSNIHKTSRLTLSISSIDIDLISNLVSSQKMVVSKRKTPSSETMSFKKFTRTNRVEGQKKWIHELNLLASNDSYSDENYDKEKLNLIIELSKELLYSGIPEQVLDLYSAYCDIVLNKIQYPSKEIETANTSEPIVPDKKLLAVVVRAYISLSDIKGALKLIQASSRLGINFDNESKSLLMADLAVSSPEGLNAALQLRQQMVDRGESIGMKGSAGLLRALHTFGIAYNDIKLPQLYSTTSNNRNQMLNRRIVTASSLLIDGAAKEEEVMANEEDTSFRMSATMIETLALEIAGKHLKLLTCKSKTTYRKDLKHADKYRNHLITTELLRIVFRTSIIISYSRNAQKNTLDKSSINQQRHRYSMIDFQIDKNIEKEEQTAIGLAGALHIMEVFKIKWDLQVADILLDECLRVGDINGITFVTQQMFERQIAVQTSTCNSLLRRYAENGDAESAYLLVYNVMMNSKEKPQNDTDITNTTTMTTPNTDTWVLLLQACLHTRKGRFYAKMVIEKLLNNNNDRSESTESVVVSSISSSISIELWNLILQHSIMSRCDKEVVNTSSPGDTSNNTATSSSCEDQNEQLFDILENMIVTGVQPQESTMLTLYNSFLSMNDARSAMKLYKMQLQGDMIRSQYMKKKSVHSSIVSQTNVLNANISSTIEKDISILYGKYTSLLSSSSNKLKTLKSEKIKMQTELLISMCLPPLSLKTVHCLLELLSIDGDYTNAKLIFKDICEGKKFISAPSSSTTTTTAAASINKINPSTNLLLRAKLDPNRTTFALIIETILKASEIQKSTNIDKTSKINKIYLGIILNLIKIMEDEYKLVPDRRIYAALILAFGRNGDIPSALGVFQEMRCFYFPDVGTLQSILDVCIENSADLRQVSIVLEEMTNQDNIDLEVYSKDILMQGFQDAKSLGTALINMEQQMPLTEYQRVEVSLTVLSVLVQAVRSSSSAVVASRKKLSAKNLQYELEDCLAFLGAAGIRLESETMEYFRMPPEPASNSPNSRHYYRQFIPQKRKQRSLLDIEIPYDLQSDLDIPLRGYNKPTSYSNTYNSTNNNINNEPYFESNSNSNQWLAHSNAMIALLNGDMDTIDSINSNIDDSIDDINLDINDIAKNNIETNQNIIISSNNIKSNTFNSIESIEINNLFKQQMKPSNKPIDLWIPPSSAVGTTTTTINKSGNSRNSIIAKTNKSNNNYNKIQENSFLNKNLKSGIIPTKEFNNLISASNNNLILKDLYKVKNRIEKRNINTVTKSSTSYNTNNVIKPSSLKK